MKKFLNKIFCKHTYAITCIPYNQYTVFCSECIFCGKRKYYKVYGSPSGTNQDKTCSVINRIYLFSIHKQYDALARYEIKTM